MFGHRREEARDPGRTAAGQAVVSGAWRSLVRGGPVGPQSRRETTGLSHPR